MVAQREDRIRHRAYEIWEREGRPEGRESEHWAQAAAEIEREGELKVEDEPQEAGRETVSTPPAGISSPLQPGATKPGGGPGRVRGGLGKPRAGEPATGNPGTAGAAGTRSGARRKKQT